MNSLEALEKISFQIDTLENYSLNECIETIEAELKVLEILKKKRVDIQFISIILKRYKFYSSTDYNYIFKEKYRLTQEEFDLIKDWLERE